MRVDQTVFVLVACASIAACSGAPGGGSAPSDPAAAAPVTAAPRVGPGNVCDRKLLDASHLSGILDEPITGTKPLSGDGQTCYFITASNDSGGPEIRVSLRPGMGRATIASFTSGHMNDYADWKPLSGIGDGAVWMPVLHELQAQKGDVLCDISAHGMSKSLANAGELAQQQRLGAVCNALFAALKLMPPPGAGAESGIKLAAGGNILDTACEHDVQPGDVADIISAPVEKQPGDGPQSCTYRAKGSFASVTISLSQGANGKSTWDTIGGTLKMERLAGVGEAALQGRAGTMVLARKGALVCSVEVGGTDNGGPLLTKDRGIALATKLGALCGKVFAAR